jgi:hypothetical protein
MTLVIFGVGLPGENLAGYTQLNRVQLLRLPTQAIAKIGNTRSSDTVYWLILPRNRALR